MPSTSLARGVPGCFVQQNKQGIPGSHLPIPCCSSISTSNPNAAPLSLSSTCTTSSSRVLQQSSGCFKVSPSPPPPAPHSLSTFSSARGWSPTLERLRPTARPPFMPSFLQGERGQCLRMKDSPPCPLSAEALIHFSWPLAVTKAAASSLVSVLHAISQS